MADKDKTATADSLTSYVILRKVENTGTGADPGTEPTLWAHVDIVSAANADAALTKHARSLPVESGSAGTFVPVAASHWKPASVGVRNDPKIVIERG